MSFQRPTSMSGPRAPEQERVITPLPEGSCLGEYLVGPRIGVGGMAEVYEAVRLGDAAGERFALKRMLPSDEHDTDLLDMFTAEAQLAACLDHPNVTRVVDFGSEGAVHFLVMELVEGCSLARLMRLHEGSGVPLPLALHIVHEAAQALHYAHGLRDEQGRSLDIVHRDVTPANLLLSRSGEVKLTDFGIAASVVSPPVAWGKPMGNVRYMAPEQLRGEPVGGEADIYSLGVILGELLLARRLFGNGGTAGEPGSGRERVAQQLLAASMPEDVRSVVLRMLRRMPFQRPTAREVMKLLRACSGVPAPPRPAGELAAHVVAACSSVRVQGSAGASSVPQADGQAQLPGETASRWQQPTRKRPIAPVAAGRVEPSSAVHSATGGAEVLQLAPQRPARQRGRERRSRRRPWLRAACVLTLASAGVAAASVGTLPATSLSLSAPSRMEPTRAPRLSVEVRPPASPEPEDEPPPRAVDPKGPDPRLRSDRSVEPRLALKPSLTLPTGKAPLVRGVAPSSPAGHDHVARLLVDEGHRLLARGERRKARERFLRSLQASRSEGALAALARLDLANQRPDRALGWASELVERYPQRAPAWRLLAKVYEAQGRTEDASHARARADMLSTHLRWR